MGVFSRIKKAAVAVKNAAVATAVAIKDTAVATVEVVKEAVQPVVDTVKSVIHKADEARLYAAEALADTIITNSNLSSQIETKPARSLDEALRMASGEKTSITAQDVSRTSAMTKATYDISKGKETGQAAIDQMKKNGLDVTVIPGVDGKGAEAIVTRDRQGRVTVAFRGTFTMEEKLADTKAALVPLDAARPEVLVHSGFKAQLDEIYDKVKEAIGPAAKEVTFSGHSLGGAMANLAAVRYRNEGNKAALEVITFGAPRAGNPAFADAVTQATGGNVVRVVNDQDPVVTIVTLKDYRHAGNPVVITGKGLAVGGKDTEDTYRQALASSANAALSFDYGNAHQMGARYDLAVQQQVTTDASRLRDALRDSSYATSIALAAGGVTASVQTQAMSVPVAVKQGAKSI